MTVPIVPGEPEPTPPPQVVYVPMVSAEHIATGVNQGLWKNRSQTLYLIVAMPLFVAVCCGILALAMWLFPSK